MDATTPQRWRQYADTLRELAAGYRARSTDSPEHWRAFELREAARLEANAEFAMNMAERDEQLLMEMGDEPA